MTLSNVKLTLVESMEDVDNFLRWLGERRAIMGVDIETTGLHLAKDSIRLVQFGDAQQGWALPYRDWRGVVKHVLDTYQEPVVLHHGKFDAGFLQKDGLTFPWARAHDTMPMCFLTDSRGPKSLKKASALYVDEAAANGERALQIKMKQNNWGYDNVPIDLPEYWGYGALDTVLTARLAENLWPRVQEFREAYELELACQRVLCDMEARGCLIDVPYSEQSLADVESQLDATMEELAGVNPSSSNEIVLAIHKEGFNLSKRTPSGNLSVDDEVLSGLAAAGSKVAANVVKARGLMKIGTSYFENFLSYHADGVLHPHINQLAARTGRMSVTEPALQTLPRTALVRNAFIPREGNKLVLIDYDSQELRVVAHIGQDESMLKAFREGHDLHGETASALYGQAWTPKNRTTAKNGMYSWTYGAGISKFAKTVGVSEGEAQAVFDTLKRLYPGIARAMAQVTRTVREREDEQGFGYVKALHDGRHLRVEANKAYMGLNTLVQSTCAVVLKQALVDLDLAGLGEYLILPVHDEVLLDVPEDLVDEVVPVAIDTLRRDDFSAPLTVEAKVVSRWGEPYD